MHTMNHFTLKDKVLAVLEPDASKREQWTQTLDLFPVSVSPCIRTFVSKIQQYKTENKKVMVAGDYDTDGILATTIMVKGLRKYGLECGFYIPDRIREGYGLHEQTVKLVSQKGYHSIITVDNGVKAFPALELAHRLGIETIVTDHHTLEQEVPCDLLVHPTLMEDSFHTLCGAGVAYECMRALGMDTTDMLELAAIASIGDMMIVTGQTRALIQQGLKSLNHTHNHHIFELASDRELNEVSVAFQVVPKLNAIGRLSNLANVNNVVRYFLTEDLRDIVAFRNQITEVNNLRKRLSDEMLKHARTKCYANEDVLLIMDPSYHEGIIGLVAGSLCSQTGKPVIIMTKTPEGYKASMRAPDGFDCMDFLGQYPSYVAYGGHKQAAGFTVSLKEYEMFRGYVRKRAMSYQWEPVPFSSLPICMEELSIEAIESLDELRPFGPGFICPHFELKHPDIKSFYMFQNGKHGKYTLSNGIQCMRFNQSEADRQNANRSVSSFIGNLQVSEYRSKKQATFIIEQTKYDE